MSAAEQANECSASELVGGRAIGSILYVSIPQTFYPSYTSVRKRITALVNT